MNNLLSWHREERTPWRRDLPSQLPFHLALSLLLSLPFLTLIDETGFWIIHLCLNHCLPESFDRLARSKIWPTQSLFVFPSFPSFSDLQPIWSLRTIDSSFLQQVSHRRRYTDSDSFSLSKVTATDFELLFWLFPFVFLIVPKEPLPTWSSASQLNGLLMESVSILSNQVSVTLNKPQVSRNARRIVQARSRNDEVSMWSLFWSLLRSASSSLSLSYLRLISLSLV